MPTNETLRRSHTYSIDTSKTDTSLNAIQSRYFANIQTTSNDRIAFSSKPDHMSKILTIMLP